MRAAFVREMVVTGIALACSLPSFAQTGDPGFIAFFRGLFRQVAPGDTGPAPRESNLLTDLAEFFRTNGCISDPAARKFLEERALLVPKDVLNLAQVGPGMLPVKVSGTKAQAVLHTVTFPMHISGAGGGQKYIAKPLVGALGYVADSPLSWADPAKSPRGAYSFNCSWYLNFALAGGASPANLKTESSAAIEKKQAMMVARASVFSPVAIALIPSIAPANTSQQPSARADILWAIMAEAGQTPDITESTEAVVARELDMLWYASSSTSSMQGKADISSDISVGAGVISVRAAGAASTSVAYSASFDSFDTYVISDVLDPVRRTVSKIRSDLKFLVDTARHDPPVRQGPGYDFKFRSLPPKACGAAWMVEDVSTNQPSQVNVQVDKGEEKDGGCKVSLYPASAVDSEKNIRISASPDFGPLTTKFVVKLNMQ